MKFLLSILILHSIILSAHAIEFDVMTYNLKELDSVKIKNRESNSQLFYQKEVFKNSRPEIMAFNEIQHDLVSVPTLDFTSSGENLKILADFLELPYKDHAFALSIAGANAKRNENDEYEISSRRATLLSDSVNFGMFPGQYSLGLITQFEIIRRHEIKNLLWKDVNPARDFSTLRDSMGRAIDANTIALFDKVLLETVVKIGEREVYVIVAHLTPQTDRGFSNHINPKRNEDQLIFLKNYLTDLMKQSKPFIVLGDLNADPREGTPSANALKELLELTKSGNLTNPLPTREESGFGPSNYLIQLDYILFSTEFELIHLEAMRPAPERVELGCPENEEVPFNSELEEGRRTVNYQRAGKRCYASVNQDYFAAKIASDHFPVKARLRLKAE